MYNNIRYDFSDTHFTPYIFDRHIIYAHRLKIYLCIISFLFFRIQTMFIYGKNYHIEFFQYILNISIPNYIISTI